MGLITYSGIVLLLIAGSVRKPAFALGAFLCMFGLEQWGAAKIGFVASNGSFTNYLAAAIVMIALGVKLLRSRNLRIVTGPVQLLSVALYLYAMATLLWTPGYGIAVVEWRAQLPYLCLSVLVLPFLIQNVDEAAEGMHGTLIAGGILCVCLAFFVNWGYRSIESEVSAGGDIQLPLAIAQLGAIIFVLAVIYVPWRGASAILALALVAVSVLLVIKTGSRGQLVAMIASAILFLPVARGWSMSRGYVASLLLAAVVAGGVWIILPDLSSMLAIDPETRFDADRAVVDYSERIENARRLFEIYVSSSIPELLFGLGNSASFSLIGFYPHIVPIEILCELGIVGFGLFLTIVILTIRTAVRFMVSSAELPDGGATSRRVVASLCALAVIEVLLAFKEGSLVRDVNLLLFPILIEGIVPSLLARRRSALGAEPSPPRVRPRLLEGDNVGIPRSTKMEIRHGR